MIGENFPYIIAVSILFVVFIMTFFHTYSRFLGRERSVSIHRGGLSILSSFLKKYEDKKWNESFNCSSWNKTVVKYRIKAPNCTLGPKVPNKTDRITTISSPVLINNQNDIGKIEVSVWE